MRQSGHGLHRPIDHAAKSPRQVVRPGAVLVLTALLIWGCCCGQSPAGDRSKLEYNRDVRPILAENCFACHGPDSAARKADLRLDRREAAIEAGAIVPGDPQTSELVARINAPDPKEAMPPRSTTKTLSAQQKDVLARWIADGAAYQPHWSLIPPRRPELPAVRDLSWVHKSDRSVRAGQARGARVAARARGRRADAGAALGLDLTGLPPDPALVETFVNNPAPDAYEDLVDRLLDSPRWGEHRARYWLDAARYADTNGYHFDNYREAWAYRDWVIGAFNRNLRSTVSRSSNSPATSCPSHARPAGRLGIQPLQRDDQRRRRHPRGIPGSLHPRPHRDRVAGLDGPDGRLRGLPRSQVRPARASASFTSCRRSSTTRRSRSWTATSRTRRRPSSFPRRPIAPAGRSWAAERSEVRKRLDDRGHSARPDFANWLAAADPRALEAQVPSAGLELAALDPAAGESPQQKPFESAEAGDFEKDHAFSFGAWIKIPDAKSYGSVLARMDDRNNYRGWDIWLEGGRIGAHLVHQWPDDASRSSRANRCRRAYGPTCSSPTTARERLRA